MVQKQNRGREEKFHNMMFDLETKGYTLIEGKKCWTFILNGLKT